ncbi:hypothetical protein EDC01DRAFT_630750 [Geopyxis carbonaria]|nr:hypothetical protein EDC01DRAFT_630750 [Geopyxis carbonaria]
MTSPSHIAEKRLALLARRIAEYEAKLEFLDNKLNKKTKELSNIVVELQNKSKELKQKEKQLAQLDKDIQHLSEINAIQQNQKDEYAEEDMSDDSSLTDLTEWEPMFEAMGWKA